MRNFRFNRFTRTSTNPPNNMPLLILVLSLLFPLLAINVTSAQPSKKSMTNKQTTKTNFVKTKQTAEGRVVYFNNRTLKLNADAWPVYGNRDAKYLFVAMVDYASSNNNRMHQTFLDAKSLIGADVATVILPVPSSKKCNVYATETAAINNSSCDLAFLAMAVWRTSPDKFNRYHKWSMSRETPPSFAESKLYAQSLVGIENLKLALKTTGPAKDIAKATDIYGKIGGGTIPKYLFPTKTISEYTIEPAKLKQVIESQLNK